MPEFNDGSLHDDSAWMPESEMICPTCGRDRERYINYVLNVKAITCPDCKAAKWAARKADFLAHEADLVARTAALCQGTPEELRERGRRDAADLWG